MRRASPTPFGLTIRPGIPEADGGGVVTEREAADLSLSDARDLLDWLEGNGLQASDVEMTPAGRMTVRWVE
jgi:hypothetical protein